MKKILITGAWKYSEDEYAYLLEKGYDICFVQNEKDELPPEAYQAEFIICNSLFVYHNIEKFTCLKAVQLTSAGYDRVPMEYTKEHGIAVYNAKNVYSKPMAEFAVCGVLTLYKKFGFFAENQKNHKWAKHRGLLELTDKAVCIVGCGDVGKECARKFKAFDSRVIGVDKYPAEHPCFDEMFCIEDIDKILPCADILVLSVPLTEETYHLIDKDRLELLKSTAVIVNISRGAVADTEALIGALPNLGGAVLDVFEEEPLSENSPLWDMENVIITPHNSFVGEKNGERLFRVIAENLERWNRVNG